MKFNNKIDDEIMPYRKKKNKTRKKSSHKHIYKIYLTTNKNKASMTLTPSWIVKGKRSVTLTKVYLFEKCEICGFERQKFIFIDVNGDIFNKAIELEEGVKNEIKKM